MFSCRRLVNMETKRVRFQKVLVKEAILGQGLIDMKTERVRFQKVVVKGAVLGQGLVDRETGRVRFQASVFYRDSLCRRVD